MSDTIKINRETTADELMTVMEHVLGRLIDQIGVGPTVGVLFGTAVLMAVEDSQRHV